MLRLVILTVGLVSLLMLAVNAGFMLASPKRWFRLPNWLRGSGSLTADRYGSGFGAFVNRLTGSVILAGMAWVLYDLLLS